MFLQTINLWFKKTNNKTKLFVTKIIIEKIENNINDNIIDLKIWNLNKINDKIIEFNNNLKNKIYIKLKIVIRRYRNETDRLLLHY